MDKQTNKSIRRGRRRAGLRKRISGTPGKPRLSIYKSLKHIYAQVIDDLAGKTICSASTQSLEPAPAKSGGNAGAAEVGKSIAEKAKAAGVTAVAFDRGGFRYHGRVKALADAARKGGLKF
ncbi:MAG TPA: 50S ribosomal protein L18 [Phycisphaerales bacterium]|nr:50S ribosomal protein L18 [Phycisphaerales bacterium]